MSKELFQMLHRGYFPKELPPAFNTYSYALKADDIKRHLKREWGKVTTTPIHCSIPKNELGRRFIQVLHPLPFFYLAEYVSQQYSNLMRVCRRSSISCSRPMQSSRLKHRFLNPNSKSVASFKEELQKRSLDKYVELRVDISNFYPSIYTHIIPWAFVGRDTAKEIWLCKKEKTTPECSRADVESYEVADKIDKLIEHCQEKQTHGIPIGPDTSYIVAEAILSQIDSQIASKIKDICGVRYYDDYYLFFDTTEEAEYALKVMIDAFKQFGLEVNLSKVEINQIPISAIEHYAVVLSSYGFKSDKKSHMFQVYFELIWSLVRECPGKAQTILRYGLSVLERNLPEELSVHEEKLLYILLFKTAVLMPAVVPEILSVTDKMGSEPSPDVLTRMTNAVFKRHIQLGNHIEIMWALWVCKKYSLDIDVNIIRDIFNLNHPLCSLMSLDYLNNAKPKMLSDPIIEAEIKRIVSLFSARSLYDENWILLYEGTIKGWLPKIHFVEDDLFFSYLSENNISFYDANNEADYLSAAYILGLPLDIPEYILEETKTETSAIMKDIKKKAMEDLDIGDFDEFDIEEEIDRKIEDNEIRDFLFEELLRNIMQGDDVDTEKIVEEYVAILNEVKDY